MATSPHVPRIAERRGLLRVVLYTVACAIAGVAVLIWVFLGLRTQNWSIRPPFTPAAEELDGDELFAVLRAAGLCVTGIAAAGGVAVAVRRQAATEDANRLGVAAQQVAADAYALDQERSGRERVDRLRDRYTTAAGQLGHEDAAVRLAGVYAMASLADDWLALGDGGEAQVCVDVLCAYQRTPRYPDPEAFPRPASSGVLIQRKSYALEREADTRVRETITRVITAHLQEDAERSWELMNFDFAGATFTGVHDFSGAQFTRCTVSFRDAIFADGLMVFSQARFGGALVSFDDAHFDGTVLLFPWAEFTGGTVTFADADFKAGAFEFEGAEFSGGWLRFTQARFHGTHLSFAAVASFTGAHVRFDGARFDDGLVAFSTTALSPEQVAAHQAAFKGQSRGGGEASFDGGRVWFQGAIPVPGVCVGPWGDTPPNGPWPPDEEEPDQ